MVDVEDAVHPFVYHIVHNFLHAGHPHGVHSCTRPRGGIPFVLVVERDRAHMGVPGYGHADYPKTGFLEHMDEFTGGLRLPPGGFVILWCAGGPGLYPHIVGVSAVCVKGIAKIPAGAHVEDCFRGAFKGVRGVRCVRLVWFIGPTGLVLFVLWLLLRRGGGIHRPAPECKRGKNAQYDGFFHHPFREG